MLWPVLGTAALLVTANPLTLGRRPLRSLTPVPPLQSRPESQSDSPFQCCVSLPRAAPALSKTKHTNRVYDSVLCILFGHGALCLAARHFTHTAKHFQFPKTSAAALCPARAASAAALAAERCCPVVDSRSASHVPANSGLKYALPRSLAFTWKLLSGLRFTMYGSCKLLSPRT